MSDTDLILQALKEHREETRQDLHELRTATVKVADAAADMGKTMARSEERHTQHEDAMKRIGRNLDDHEDRIRFLEGSHPELAKAAEVRRQAEEIQNIRNQQLASKGTVAGGWKVLTVIGTLILGAATLIGLLIRIKGVS